MFLNDSNCKFYDKYFIDDLYPYKYNSFNNTITYYDNGSPLRTSEVDMSKSLAAIAKLAVSTENDFWTPAFINLQNSQANSRVLFRGATSFNENLGIENAIVIKDPLFQNWNISNGNMISDWVLTSDIIPFSPRYGILFWYKNSQLHKLEKLLPAQIPYNCIVSPTSDYSYGNIRITTTTKLAKKNNDTFYILDREQPKIIDFPLDQVLPSTSNKYFEISKLLADNEDLKRENIFFKLNNYDSLIESNPGLSIWIPSGETYSYYRSKEEEEERVFEGIASSTYLSPILSNIYREIYHVLTLRYKKNFSVDNPHEPVPFFSFSQSKLVKKLAYALATFPTMDRTTVSLLNTDSIYNIIQKYLMIGQERLLYQTLVEISLQMNVLISNSNIVDSQTYVSGLVNSKEQLFYRLISKYGSKLRLFGKSSISYKKQLKYGPHVKINQDVISRCDSSLENQTVFNNIKFNVGEFVVRTQLGPDVSKLKLGNIRKNDKEISVPLWDVVKKDLKNSRMPITAGPDLDVNFDDDELLSTGLPPVQSSEETDEETDQKKINREIKIELKEAIADVSGNFFDPNILGGEKIDVLWTRISGPDCLKFSDGRLSKISGQGLGGSSFSSSGRYATSTDSNPILYIKKPGRYVVQLRVKASFGVIYDNAVIHVNSSEYEPKYKRSQRLAPAKTQYLRPKNQLVVMVPNIRECYFGKQGVFWISYCDLSVKLPASVSLQENVNNLPQIGTTSLPEVASLGNNYTKFAIPMPEDSNGNKKINNKPVFLSIDYDCNNTTVDINHITLTNLMDNNPECYNCQSLYEGILGSDGFVVDAGIGGQSFLDPSDNDQYTTVGESSISLTTNKTLVKSYGGFSKDVVKNFNVNIPFHPQPGQILPNIATTGDLLNEPRSEDGKSQHLCHDTDVQHNASIIFEKGCFHPYYGWTNNKKYTNQSSVIRFNPSHRPVQSFKGPGMYDLNNDFSDGKPRIYKSSVVIKVNGDSLDPAPQEDPEAMKAEILAREKAESSDHITHYGYKSIGGQISLKALALNDEYDVDFPVEDDAPVSSSDYCTDRVSETSYTATYSYGRPGTHIPVSKRPSSPLRRWNREGASSIGNIEVKINFLNYINPKDLVVWLEIGACGRVSQSLNPPPDDSGKRPPPKDPWYDGSYSSTFSELSKLPDSEIKNYLYGLWKLNNNDILDSEESAGDAFTGNSKPPMGGTYRVYLLNRDHVSSADYNINLKFSDLLDLDKISHNHNNSSTLYIDNNISESINNTIDLAPTLSAAGYSDEQIYKYKKIIIENRLLNNSHSFRKISGMPLFAPANTKEKKGPPGNSSNTTFTLCVAVVGESDIFEPYDRVFNNEQVCGFSSSLLKNRSSLVANSICSWELILHRSKDNLGFVPGDALGSIRYESEPSIPGHNFIADMSNKLHLLPPPILNAPNAYLLDGRLCRYSKDVLNQPTYLRPPPMNISPITFMMPASATAALVAVSQVEAGLNEQTRQIVNWLGANRRRQQKELFDREWFVPVYDKYPYGGYDKALLSVSKDGQLYYKMEAAIFRYNNCIVMEKNKHNFCRLHYHSHLKNLSKFKLQNIPIDEKENINLSTLEKLLKPYIKTYDNISSYIASGPKNRDIIKLKTPPEAENSEELSQEELERALKKNIFIWDSTENIPIHIEECNFSIFFQNEQLSAYTNISDLIKNPSLLGFLIRSNRFRYTKGLRAYNFFSNNKNITTIKVNDNLTNEQIKSIENLTKQVETERSKQKKEPDELIRSTIDDRINELENQIFDIRYIKSINTITNLGYVFNGTEYYTVFILSEPCNGDVITLSSSQSKRIVVYNKKSTIDDDEIKKSIPVDLWVAPPQSQLSTDSPETHPVCWGAGNYGYGANIVNLNQISLQNIQNQIIPLTDRIDIEKNSKMHPNTLKILDEYDDSVFINSSILSLGYGYNLDLPPNDSDLTFNENIVYSEPDTKDISKKFFENIQNRVYINNKDSYSYIELDILIDNNDKFLAKGNIVFDKDIKQKIVYGFQGDHDSSIKLLEERVAELHELIKKQEKITKSSSKKYKNTNFINDLDIEKDKLQKLIEEHQTILYYIDLLGTKDQSITPSIPQISVIVEKSSSGSISFKEIVNNNYYWINIDPEQGCSIDKDRTVKILKEVTYNCIPRGDQISKNTDHVCAGEGSLRSIVLNNGKDESIDTSTDAKYTLSQKAIDNIKKSYPNLVWPDNDDINYIVERRFFLNLHGEEIAQLVFAKYKYITPIGPAEPDIPPDGDVKNKVYNIFNLDSTNKLLVEFKRIPRSIKGVDTQYEMFEPDDYGELTKSTTPAEGGPIDATLRMWKCLDPKTGAYVKPPPYYNWLNEMIFRLYFGSADGVEYLGRNKITSRDIMYWVPYDYS